MKRNILLSILLLSFSITVQAQSKDEQAVRQVLKDITNANLKRDMAAFDRLYAPDFVFINYQGQKFNKQERIANLKSIPAPESFAFTNEHIRMYGNVAVVNAEVKMKPHGQEAMTHLVTIVLMKKNGRWVEVNAQATMKGMNMN